MFNCNSPLYRLKKKIYAVITVKEMCELFKKQLAKWNSADPILPIKEKYIKDFIKGGKFDAAAFSADIENWYAEKVDALKNYIPYAEKCLILVLKSAEPRGYFPAFVDKYEYAGKLYHCLLVAKKILDSLKNNYAE